MQYLERDCRGLIIPANRLLVAATMTRYAAKVNLADEINKSSRLNKISANRQCNSEARQKGVRLRAAWGWGNVQSEAAKRWDGATC
jgi:hypothetical protein